MNFTEAVAEIVLTTKRPDRANLARRKVNEAISFFVLDNEFSRDFYEQLVTIDATQYTQAFPISDLTRFRKFKYIKLAGTKKFLDRLPDSELFKTCENRSKYYVVGTNVNVSLPSLAASLDVGYWQHPPVLTDAQTNRTHWMLDVSPWMIIERALGDCFKDIGDEKSYREHAITAREMYLAFRRDQGISTQ